MESSKRERYKQYEAYIRPKQNYAKYREEFENMKDSDKAPIPLFPVLLRDIAIVVEGNPIQKSSNVNGFTCEQLSKHFQQFFNILSNDYKFDGLIKEANRFYLKELPNIIEDDNILYDLSLTIQPRSILQVKRKRSISCKEKEEEFPNILTKSKKISKSIKNLTLIDALDNGPIAQELRPKVSLIIMII
eukprot:TRINITY_DN13356_c0_g1_i1.p1 TRINITY_DN13356_c0_g1~~TRINITY_DN13356_c0_g1_i1.p1  ORF type:complete len:189 (+),score=46.53 TRINITY_DN13356_c0_g1_i1:101-667(+)